MGATTGAKNVEEAIRHYPAAREHLISILQEVQGLEGYLSRESIGKIADYLKLPSSKVFGVATFYNQFRLNRPGKIQIQVCRGTACHVKGSLALLESLKLLLGIDVGETTKDGIFSLETVACVGGCSIAPVITANGRFFGRLDRKKLETLIERFRATGVGSDGIGTPTGVAAVREADRGSAPGEVAE
jgi:NADH-quinone oxidoreductase subunit E